MTHKPDDDAAWLLELAETADEVEEPRFRRIAARLQQQDGDAPRDESASDQAASA